MSKKLHTRILVEAGLMIAIALMLSFIVIYRAPQGGSVTAASMVPIMVFSLRWGLKAGLICALGYGLLQMMINPFIVHPVQAILDYPAAYTVLGLAGAFTRYPTIGVTVSIASRFVAHVVSGVVFFASYAPEGTPVLAYSLIYNISFFGPEALISVVAVYFLTRQKLFTLARPDLQA